MSTKNNLPFSNQFERGHSFNWAGTWTEGKYYMNDEYVTDFVVFENAILACRKNHKATEELTPKLVFLNGKVKDVDSPYWNFILAINDYGIVVSSTYIASATESDVQKDPTVIIRDPYIFIEYSSGAYTYVPAKDLVVGINVGLPTLTQKMLDDLPPESIPDDYLVIPDETDIVDGETGSNYLDILFSSIRKLQAEVAKLRNSFRFGISSYTGRDTATSAIVDEYSNISDNEPLWSIEEDDLSEIEDATADFENSFIPFEPRSEISYDQTGYAEFRNNVTTTNQVTNAYKGITDTKLFSYLTVSNPNVTFVLKDLSNNLNDIVINVSDLISSYNPNNERYNICLLVSRTMNVEDDDTEYGKNYIWLSIGYFNTNRTIAEGYYNPNTNTLGKILINTNSKYYINSVLFNNLTIWKFNGYSKYQDFSHEIIQSKPDDSDYKYKAAHLTIREVASLSELESVEDRLLNDELVWQADQKILWIKTKSGLTAISGSSKPDSGMTEQEMIEKLEELGIVYVDGTGLQLSNVSDVTFINNDTGKKFKFAVDSEGELKSTELPNKTLEQMISSKPISANSEMRGFASKVLAAQYGTSSVESEAGTYKGDIRLNSDRIKIGAVYCPLKTDTKHGCSHGFIELENTSDKDFPLLGCYLHFLHPNELDPSKLDCEHLELTGILPAGGTYLIRCKQYADPKLDADVFINVNTFDQEWFVNGEPLDLSANTTSCYAFALTYGKTVGDTVISSNTAFVQTSSVADSKAPYVYVWNYIDSLVFTSHPNTAGSWGNSVWSMKSNTITKNTFELDPAKQAYQALTQYDSSRIRNEKLGTDAMYLSLNKEFISFPNSDETYPVSRFAPKSSKEHKNVSTDKTKLDKNKPNMVTCAFGIDMLTTRTFNWISAGEFDEYVFIKNGNSWNKFESYKASDGDKEQAVGTTVRKEFGAVTINTIYKRIVGDFPGDGSHYTSHKCIIIFNNGTAVDSPITYTYVVGRADKEGNPDLEHCSEEYTFTLYPSSYAPRIYQTSDQQGFHWVEYQVWAAAAEKLNERIISDCGSENIIPILINTGDMTQNGTRINEWLDYYNAGKSLFKHLEQMNVVGNNDLCNTDITALGTGDDVGKSNGYYFHVFYCYEVNEDNLPVITGDDEVTRYIPSLYYFDSPNYRFVMINSEITYENCNNWFKKRFNNQVVNIYTGWGVPAESGNTAGYCSGFTTIYTMIYRMFNTKGAKNAIAVCHEMPFTVITNNSLKDVANIKSNYRSLNGSTTTLIGSHTNQLTGNDLVGIHWLSRMLEHFHIKLCIGGHKHTYACTFPVRENYSYVVDDTTYSSEDGPMQMSETLENDSVIWDNNGVNTTKLPFVKYTGSSSAMFNPGEGYFSPATVKADLTGGVTYFMCQATGYKLTSNKELPSERQHFSCLIPHTTIVNNADTADDSQKYPMFTIIRMSGDTYTIKLAKVTNIFTSGFKFSQIAYSSGTPAFEYATPVSDSRYCTWSSTETPIISI